MKDYLKEIFLMEESGEEVKTTKLAKKLQVKPASITDMVKKIALMGFISYKPYHSIKLTKKGKRIVMKILRKHRLLEKLFVDFIGLDKNLACKEASRLELLLSDKVANSICMTFNHPKICPCGNPIYQDKSCCE